MTVFGRATTVGESISFLRLYEFTVLLMFQVFFESLEVPAFYVTLPAILSCYASGRGSGIILDIGDSVTHIMPIYEGNQHVEQGHRLRSQITERSGQPRTNYKSKVHCAQSSQILESSKSVT